MTIDKERLAAEIIAAVESYCHEPREQSPEDLRDAVAGVIVAAFAEAELAQSDTLDVLDRLSALEATAAEHSAALGQLLGFAQQAYPAIAQTANMVVLLRAGLAISLSGAFGATINPGDEHIARVLAAFGIDARRSFGITDAAGQVVL